MIWHGDGLVYFVEHRDRIGDVLGVEVKGYWTWYSVRVYGEKGELWLSGCGPSEIGSLLGDLGYPSSYVGYPLERAKFKLGPPHDPGAGEVEELPGCDLTAYNLSILRDIREFYDRGGRMPTTAELGGCYWHLKRLEDAGKIRRERGKGIVWFEGMVPGE